MTPGRVVVSEKTRNPHVITRLPDITDCTCFFNRECSSSSDIWIFLVKNTETILSTRVFGTYDTYRSLGFSVRQLLYQISEHLGVGTVSLKSCRTDLG